MREEQAWLLQSRVNPFPVSGTLELEGGQLTFTLDAGAAEANLGWLEKQLGTDDLKSKIKSGEGVVVFDLAAQGLKIGWPIQFGGNGMELHGGDRKWLVTFEYPSGGAISNLMSISTGRKKAKRWKQAFAEA